MRYLREFVFELGSNRRLRSLALGNINLIDRSHPDENEELIEELCKFIRRNRKLLHLDLSKTGLNAEHLIEIAK
jgi:hypothetical protein